MKNPFLYNKKINYKMINYKVNLINMKKLNKLDISTQLRLIIV